MVASLPASAGRRQATADTALERRGAVQPPAPPSPRHAERVPQYRVSVLPHERSAGPEAPCCKASTPSSPESAQAPAHRAYSPPAEQGMPVAPAVELERRPWAAVVRLAPARRLTVAR